jgi:hypothetical protein
MDLTKPFNNLVAKQILKISYYTLTTGIVGVIAGVITLNLLTDTVSVEKIKPFWADSQAFILMGAVIYIIATIFKKGVDIQNENDLTV